MEFRCLEPWAKIEVKGFIDSRKKKTNEYVSVCSLRKERERRKSRGGKGEKVGEDSIRIERVRNMRGGERRGGEQKRRQKILFLSYL